MELLGLFPEEIKEWLQSHGIPAFRGDQIFSWLHKHAVERFEQMTNVPGDVILRLQEAFGTPWPLELAARRRSLDGTESICLPSRTNHNRDSLSSRGGAADGLPFDPGWLRHELFLLCHGSKRLCAQSLGCRNRDTGLVARAPTASLARVLPMSSIWVWENHWPTTGRSCARPTC